MMIDGVGVDENIEQIEGGVGAGGNMEESEVETGKHSIFIALYSNNAAYL